jgi:hypothetical protein
MSAGFSTGWTGSRLSALAGLVDVLTLFGLTAVTAMLIFYALEDRSRWYSLRARLSSRLLAGRLPFGLIEAI